MPLSGLSTILDFFFFFDYPHVLEEFRFLFKMLVLLALTSYIFSSSDTFNTWMFFSRIPGLYEKLVLLKDSIFLDFLSMKKFAK